MKKLNNKGFTLVEILAVVVILGIIATILIPAVGLIITKNKEDNYKNLKNSILSAAKVYMSDNRYNIKLAEGNCNSSNTYRNIDNISNEEINDNKLTVQLLINNDLLSTNQIKNPMNSNQTLDLSGSFVIVKYSCNSRDYVYGCFDDDKNFTNCLDIGKSHLEWSNS